MTDLSAFRASSRLNGMGVSEILVRSGQAAAFKRAGRDMIILGAGEPDFDTPDHIKAAAYRAIADGQTKYTILDGSLELKEAVQAKFERENQLSYEIREISCGAGAKQILYNAFMASLDSGDEVVIPTPYWTSYADIVKIAGGNPVEVSCGEESGFLLSPDRLEAAITDRTRWLLINSPSNPSGAAYSADDLRALAEVLRRHPQVWLMSDDMYEHILYDDRVFVTFAQVASDLRERTLTVNGVSKAYAMTGWRLGYCAGPAPLIAAMATVQSQATSCPSSVSQAAAIAALNGPQEIVRERAISFQRRRDLVVSRLNEIEGISCRLPDGAFYAYPSCAGVIGLRTLAGVVLTDDRAFADYLMEWDVAVIPGSCFGLAPFFRISYATSERELLTALDRIDAACHALVPAEAAMPV
jgi:aspartate aminotransferase